MPLAVSLFRMDLGASPLGQQHRRAYQQKRTDDEAREVHHPAVIGVRRAWKEGEVHEYPLDDRETTENSQSPSCGPPPLPRARFRIGFHFHPQYDYRVSSHVAFSEVRLRLLSFSL